MSIYLQLLLLAWVVVFVVDLSGVTASLGAWLGRPLRKPWSCSKCMTWWLGLVLAAVRDSILDPLVWAYVAALAFATPLLNNLAVAVFDLLAAIIDFVKLPKRNKK